MVRKKVYTQVHILSAAFDLLKNNGFSVITARNIANHMGISTQPIYLEFDNMEDLKLTLLKTTHESLVKDYFSVKHTGDPVVDFGLNYVNLARKNNQLYISLFTDKHSFGKELHQLSFEAFQKLVSQEDKFSSATEEKLKSLHEKLLIVATGIASLTISSIVDLSEEQWAELFRQLEG
ncbi:TetR family transcriptional regulator [Erwinia sp. CPCC 100877]|nr:TetR family transcriptional regulator [Erwinia sp. CPCC 100877]